MLEAPIPKDGGSTAPPEGCCVSPRERSERGIVGFCEFLRHGVSAGPRVVVRALLRLAYRCEWSDDGLRSRVGWTLENNCGHNGEGYSGVWRRREERPRRSRRRRFARCLAGRCPG